MPLNAIRFMDLRKFCKARYTADGEYTAIKDFEDLQPYVKKKSRNTGRIQRPRAPWSRARAAKGKLVLVDGRVEYFRGGSLYIVSVKPCMSTAV